MRYSFWPLLYNGLRTGLNFLIFLIVVYPDVKSFKGTVSREKNAYYLGGVAMFCEIDPPSKKS